MIKDELKKFIEERLRSMGCKDIGFSNGVDNYAAVFFNCDNLISFRTEISGWKHSGIQLNTNLTANTGRYRIEFFKT
jgi:hypothetical protein